MHHIGRLMAIKVAVALLVVASCACLQSNASQTVSQVPIEQRVGWVDGSCLAIMNQAVPAGAAVTVVADEKGAIVRGRVVGATTSSTVCRPLLEDRRRSNSKWSFYEVQLDGKTALGIGVTGDVKQVDGGIDLNADGRAEKFTQCSTSEGISFRVWSAMPYQGMPLWSGYYYLGYDTAANCPS
jgi:hypothetical protein